VGRWRIRLRGIGPQIEGKFWESDTQLRIGRLENLEVVLSDPSISRRHAEIVATEQGWVLRDLGSTNGTFLNGLRVGRADRKLRLRDVVQVGNLVLTVAVLEEDVSPSQETPSQGMQVEASTQHTWDRALEVVAFDAARRPQVGDKLLTLLRASHHLTHIESPNDLFRSVLEDAVAALDAQRASIVLWNEATESLELKMVSTGDKEVFGRKHFSHSLAMRAYNRGESLLCRDVSGNMELLMANSIADGAMASVICALLRSPRKKLGVLHLDRGPFQEPFNQDDLHLADALAASVSAAIECSQLMEQQQKNFLLTVSALANAVELRDAYTSKHTNRVTDYALFVAEELGLSSAERRHIAIGTPLHDIGKIGIEDSILRKPGKLTEEEFEIMKTHTIRGYEILKDLPDMGPCLPIVRNHHERWDGKGYPDGLAGERIPKLARIVAVADAFDAMTTDRPYRRALSIEAAFAEIQQKAGSQFDPEMARAFLRLRPRIEQTLLHPGSEAETLLPQVIDVSRTPTPSAGGRLEARSMTRGSRSSPSADSASTVRLPRP
jgi:HD-GYP domain-containing protein (c-di-GMP phosphodiesterase class II)/pSer/pThr/pTyr-binding forkhead associated (FHA) protein